jgi:low affinity Fe/Cu permease
MGSINKPQKNILERFSQSITAFAGSTKAFVLACMVILAWITTGPIFNFSDTWQLVINTGTTIVTFLMVFLIQRAQNKESMSIQLKLNELVAAVKGASNNLIDVEDLSESELEILHQHYRILAVMAKEFRDIHESHSVDEANKRHKLKQA